MRPFQFLNAIVMLLGACDIQFNTALSIDDLGEQACFILNPELQQCAEAYSTQDIPRAQGEPCDAATYTCEEDLVCACGICVDFDQLGDALR